MARKIEPQRTRAGWAEYYWRRWCKLGVSTSLHLFFWYQLLLEAEGP